MKTPWPEARTRALYRALSARLRAASSSGILADSWLPLWQLPADQWMPPVATLLVTEVSEDDDRRRLEALVQATAVMNLRALRRLGEIGEALTAAGVRWAVLKGADHLLRLYPGPEWRAMSDIDLLVEPQALTRAVELLAKRGLVPQASQTSVMHPAIPLTDGHLHLDLHRSPCRRGTHRVSTEELLESARPVASTVTPTVDETAAICALGESESLAVLALVLGRDTYWPEHLTPLRLAEVALLADRLDDVAIEGLEIRMRRWRAERVWHHCLDLCHWVRGGERPRWLDAQPSRHELPKSTLSWDAQKLRLAKSLALAKLQDQPLDAARYLTVEGSVSAVRALSGRRLGSWRWPRRVPSDR